MTDYCWQYGNKCEKYAADYLITKGYQIVARNFRCGIGEIDIICRKASLMIFIEVKARQNNIYGEPYEAVTKKKQQTIRRVAEYYINSQKTEGFDFRFDVLSVKLIPRGAEATVEHIIDAF